MTLAGRIAMVAWPAASLAFFRLLPPRSALLLCVIGGWLFLPDATLRLEGLPLLDKPFAVGAFALAAAVVGARSQVLALRPRLVDAAAVAWCVLPLATSISSGHGAWEGLPIALVRATSFGAPYALGRALLGDAAGLRALAIALVTGGLAYVPLCLVEICVSPRLHLWLYGFQPSEFAQTVRLGGWRPVVFLFHGISVGMWMCAAALTASWLSGRGALERLGPVPARAAAFTLVATAVLVKSLGAVILLTLGLVALHVASRAGTRLALAALVALCPLYELTRASGVLPSHVIIRATRPLLPAERHQSFATRIRSEDYLVDRALERPWLGWGGEAPTIVHGADGRLVAIADARWVRAIGENGLIGLAALTAATLLPAALALRRLAARAIASAEGAPAAALATVVVIDALDGLMNWMQSPVIPMAAGALAGWLATPAPPPDGEARPTEEQGPAAPEAVS